MSKIVFITGTTSGFGKVCALKFAANGYDLIINGRRTDRLQALADMLERKYNVAEVIYYCITLSAHVCINDLTISCTQQADAIYINRTTV